MDANDYGCMKKAVILFSGGFDSTVVLAAALANNRKCLALSFDYGQRHKVELEAAKKIALHYGVEHKIIRIDPDTFKTKNSCLVSNMSVQKNRSLEEMQNGKIPATYVPARNSLFIAYALVQAEIFEADEIHLGPNKLDQTPYPDCRPEFVESFQAIANLATKRAVEGNAPKLITPLMYMDKTEIARLGNQLNAPLELTFSCYDPQDKLPCGQCDACLLRPTVVKP
jgi:7-cyano-7-deazaguanine synthase